MYKYLMVHFDVTAQVTATSIPLLRSLFRRCLLIGSTLSLVPVLGSNRLQFLFEPNSFSYKKIKKRQNLFFLFPCFPSDNKYLLFSTKTTFSDNIKYICVSTGYIMKSEHVPRLSGESSSPSEEENGYNKDTARTVFCHLTCHYSIRARDQGGAGENQRTPGAEE